MAKTGITYNIQQELANVTKNKSYLDGTYLNKIGNVNFEEIVKHLYPGDTEKAALLNPGSYIGNIVGDKMKNFVGDAKTAYNLDFDILVESILTRGEILVKYVSAGNGKWDLQSVRGETYWESGGMELIAKIYPIYESQDAIGVPTYYLYVQSYDGSVLKNRLYQMNSLNNLSDGVEVSLDKVYELSDLIPTQTIDGLPRLVEKLEVSDRPLIDTVKSLIHSMDRKIAEAEKHFNDYSEQFKLFQNIDIPKHAYRSVDGGKVIDWDKLGKICRTQDYTAVGDIKIIKNGNELLDRALERVDDQIEQVSSITDIPISYFKETTRDSGAGKEAGSTNLFKRIQKYRTKIETCLDAAFDFLATFNTEVNRTIVWPEIIRMSESDVLNQQTTMLQNNLTSLIRAIMKTHNVDKEQANIILDEIKDDQSNGLLVSLKESAQNADALSKRSAVLNS